MNLKKKLFVGVLLTLTLTLILGTSVFADSTYITFSQASLSDGSAGYDYVYDSLNNTGELTLDGYDGAAIYLGVETEIILAEGSTNTITVTTNNAYEQTWGINAYWASLTISGRGTLNINIDMRGTGCMNGIYGIKVEDVLTIKDEANLNINIKSDRSGSSCYGLLVGNGIITQDTATLDIDIEAAYDSYGIYAYTDLINISGTGDKNITMSGDAAHVGIYLL